MLGMPSGTTAPSSREVMASRDAARLPDQITKTIVLPSGRAMGQR
jgi:hypothetical protein